MNRDQAIVDYLKVSAPPGGFTVLAMGKETEDLCDVLQRDLGALYGWQEDLLDLERIRGLPHYDVALVPPVLHKFKNWYEYLEAIVGVADIAIFETIHTQDHEKHGGPTGAYNFGLYAELRKMGEVIYNGANDRVWVVNKHKVQGEEAQIAILAEILHGFDVNTNDEHFHVVQGDEPAIAKALIGALEFHGWTLNYHPEITAANLNQVIVQTPVPQAPVDYKPERLEK